MYPLPPELSAKILEILGPDDAEHLHDRIAILLVRENSRMRQQVGELWRDLSKAASRDDGDYGALMAASGGEFACEHIVNKILKPNVYFNSIKAEESTEEIDRIIEDFYEEDDYGI